MERRCVSWWAFFFVALVIQATAHVKGRQLSSTSAVQQTDAGCSCLPSWNWNGRLITSGCSNPDQDPRGAWCPVEPSTCPLAYGTFVRNGSVYTFDYCQEEDRPAARARTLHGCLCRKEWSWPLVTGVNKTYYGTCAAPDGARRSWCMVEAGSCPQGTKLQHDKDFCDSSYVAGETHLDTSSIHAQSNMCECLTSWNFSGKVFNGCANPDQDVRGSWCQVSPDCENAYSVYENSKEQADFKWDYCTVKSPVVGMGTLFGCTCLPSWGPGGKYKAINGQSCANPEGWSLGQQLDHLSPSFCQVDVRSCEPSSSRLIQLDGHFYDSCWSFGSFLPLLSSISRTRHSDGRAPTPTRDATRGQRSKLMERVLWACIILAGIATVLLIALLVRQYKLSETDDKGFPRPPLTTIISRLLGFRPYDRLVEDPEGVALVEIHPAGGGPSRKHSSSGHASHPGNRPPRSAPDTLTNGQASSRPSSPDSQCSIRRGLDSVEGNGAFVRTPYGTLVRTHSGHLMRVPAERLEQAIREARRHRALMRSGRKAPRGIPRSQSLRRMASAMFDRTNSSSSLSSTSDMDLSGPSVVRPHRVVYQKLDLEEPPMSPVMESERGSAEFSGGAVAGGEEAGGEGQGTPSSQLVVGKPEGGAGTGSGSSPVQQQVSPHLAKPTHACHPHLKPHYESNPNDLLHGHSPLYPGAPNRASGPSVAAKDNQLMITPPNQRIRGSLHDSSNSYGNSPYISRPLQAKLDAAADLLSPTEHRIKSPVSPPCPDCASPLAKMQHAFTAIQQTQDTCGAGVEVDMPDMVRDLLERTDHCSPGSRHSGGSPAADAASLTRSRSEITMAGDTAKELLNKQERQKLRRLLRRGSGGRRKHHFGKAIDESTSGGEVEYNAAGWSDVHSPSQRTTSTPAKVGHGSERDAWGFVNWGGNGAHQHRRTVSGDSDVFGVGLMLGGGLDHMTFAGPGTHNIHGRN